MKSDDAIFELDITNQATKRTITVEVNGAKAAARYKNKMQKSGYQVKSRVISA